MPAVLVPILLALAVQAAGTALTATLTFFLSRSLRRAYLDYWWRGWAWLAVGLTALFVSLLAPAGRPVLEPLYYFGEYAFVLLLVAGCRNFASGAALERRDLVRFAVPAALLALALPWVHPRMTLRFIPQAAVLALFFAVAFRSLQRGRRPETEGPGFRIMSLALLALSINFGHYVPVLIYRALAGVELPLAYTSATSLVDLILETVLGFGMVVLVMEDVRREMESAMRELRETRDRVESLARLDPLTESLNRHAFYSLVEKNRSSLVPALHGCVTVADVDSLRPINESFGPTAGDAAIRAVGRAIRQVIRADDLVFRWGSDEFLVLLFGVAEEEGRRRLAGINALLERVVVPGSAEPLRITVSMGTAAFSVQQPLEKAIEAAHEAMDRRKQARRSTAPGTG